MFEYLGSTLDLLLSHDTAKLAALIVWLAALYLTLHTAIERAFTDFERERREIAAREDR